MRAISDPAEVSHPGYAEGLRAAVCAAVGYGIETTEREGPDSPIPVALLAQARLAARAGIPLDTVLRRYFAGYSLLGYFILEEAAHAGITDGSELKRLFGAHAGIFDRLLGGVSEEYARELQSFSASANRRRVERIERLLAGEMVDTAGLGYEFDCRHVGIVAAGTDAERSIRNLAAKLDCHFLCVPRDDGVLWAWLGARAAIDPGDLLRRLPSFQGDGMHVAFGEPGESVAGWRLTHRQAVAALRVAECGPDPAVRYSEVALLAAVMRDELLVTSLSELYLQPLSRRPDGDHLMCTLRAYSRAETNISSTAAALGVSRQTVRNRLQAVEGLFERPLRDCLTDIQLALRLAEPPGGSTLLRKARD